MKVYDLDCSQHQSSIGVVDSAVGEGPQKVPSHRFGWASLRWARMSRT